MWDDEDDGFDVSFGFGGGRRVSRENKDARRMKELNLQSQLADRSSEVQQLKQDIEKLTLTTQAIWELLQAKTGYANEHITAKIKEINMRDAQVKKTTISCPSCQRNVSAKTGKCMYCGTQAVVESVF